MDDDLNGAASANGNAAGGSNRPTRPASVPPGERKPGLALTDRHAILLALILAITGILLLFYLGNMGQPKLVAVNEIGRQPDNARVQFSGTVEQVTEKESSTSLRVCDENGACVSASVLHAQNPYLFRAGDPVTVTGRVSTYYDRKSVLAEKVELG